jgi:RNase P subunit RPR2
MKKSSKTEAEKHINDFFKVIKNKSPKEIKKIKKLAMSYNFPLKEKRKLFCKKCFVPYSGKEKIRIKNKVKSITCDNCEEISRWKLNN